MAKPFAKAFYRSKEWLACRAAYIKSVFGLCEHKGCRKPGYILHHKTHLTPENIGDPDVTLNWSNLRYVCKDCHELEHHDSLPTREDVMFTDDGQLIKR